jgi:dihydroneopterin aldolase
MNNDDSCSGGAPSGVTLFLDNYRTMARIGVYPSERAREQRVRVDIAIRVENCAPPFSRRNVLDYNHLRDGVRAIIDAGHIEYQETFCASIVSLCLSLPGVSHARVRVAKLEAFSDCDAVGCEMARSRDERCPGD